MKHIKSIKLNESKVVRFDNIGELKKIIRDLPDDMGVGVTTNGGDGFTSYYSYIGECGDFPGEIFFIISVD